MANTNILDISKLKIGYKEKRNCYKALMEYIFSENEKICALYGLIRTGKSVLMKQCAKELTEKGISCMYAECDHITSMNEVKPLLDKALKDGVKAVFLDEITSAEDIQYNSSFLSNVYAAQGLRIVIAGTDSLNIAFARGTELYDRIETIHTSYIPFAEYNRLLGKGIDDYIKYGGTLIDTTYKDNHELEAYQNTAIVSNIIHSIKRSEDSSIFPPVLTETYSNRELASVINNTIDRLCQYVTLRAFDRDYKNSVMATTTRSLKKEHDYEEELNKDSIISKTKEIFEIKNKSEMLTDMTEEHLKEVKNYLQGLDLLVRIPVYTSYKDMAKTYDLEIISQPGMVYAHATELLKELQNNEVWRKEIPFEDKNRFMERAEHHVKGIILENEILVNTYKLFNSDNVYVSKLSVREIFGGAVMPYEAGMIVLDTEKRVASVFEVSYSEKPEKEQTKNLLDSNFISYIEKNFGRVSNRFVIYNGKSVHTDDADYINAEEYFKVIEHLKGRAWKEAAKILANDGNIEKNSV